MTEYCANDPCESPAVKAARHPNGSFTPLCRTCAQAYKWGQHHSRSHIVDMDSIAKFTPITSVVYCFPDGMMLMRRGETYRVYDIDPSRAALVCNIVNRLPGTVFAKTYSWEWRATPE